MLLFGALLAILSVFVELAAIATLLPITTLASGKDLAPDSRTFALFSWIGLTPSFRVLLLTFTGLLGLRVVTQSASQAIATYLGKRIQADLSSNAFSEIILSFSLRDIEEKSIGHFISLAGDETARAGAVIMLLHQLLASLALTGVYLATLFLFSRWIGFGVVAVLLFGYLALVRFFRASRRLGERLSEERRVAYSVFLDSMNGLRSVRAFSAEPYVSAQYESIIKKYTMTGFWIDFVNQLARAIPALLLLVGLALITALLPPATAPTDLAFWVTVIVLLLRFFPAAGQCLNLGLRLSSEANAAHDVTEVVGRATNRLPEERGVPLSEPIREVTGRGIWFNHGSKPVLRGLSFRLVSGRSYAIMGPSGSGKSTLLDLILGFYQPDKGEIFINGNSCAGLDTRSRRQSILLLGQQPTIFNDTVFNNITFGLTSSTAAVEEACRLACLDEVVSELDQGLDTALAYQGSNLSGGQRQRIGLARALLRDPQVLLLDESTSALDRPTRDRVTKAILAEYAKRIVVFATHDREISDQVDEVIQLEPLPTTL